MFQPSLEAIEIGRMVFKVYRLCDVVHIKCSQVYAAPAVNGNDLSGDVRRFVYQKLYGARDVIGFALAFEQRVRDDLAPLFLVHPRLVFRPNDDTGGHGIDAHLWRQLLRQALGQRDQSSLGGAVQQMAVHRSFCVDIRDVHDAALSAAQFCRCRLGQEQRGFQVGSDQVVPLCFIYIRQRGSVKTRSVVDQRVKLPEFIDDLAHQLLQGMKIEQISLEHRGTLRTKFVQFLLQGQRLPVRAAVMHGDTSPRRMQAAADRRANAFRPACHQYHFVLHPTFPVTKLSLLLNLSTRRLYPTMPSPLAVTLPIPDAEAAAHSARLVEFIRRDIDAQGGWISFARYMELALYAPGLGYYTAGAHKFGAAGDFITAPEISPLYGRTVARQVAEIMAGSAPHILELGAGSGKLAADMLAELERLGNLPDSYAILEVSADLRARQQDLLRIRLPHLMGRVHWLDDLPDRYSGAIVANEVLDALPVHLVHWRHSAIAERGVMWGEHGFTWRECVIGDPSLLHAAQQVKVQDDYVSEICFASRGLVNSLAHKLERGAVLFIDYGFGAREFYHSQRRSGTLMCHYRHHVHDDPFFLPGLQDITAHVNFTDIAECGIEAGLELLGYTTQAYFLINCGITAMRKDVPPESDREYQLFSAQLQKLTSPAEMGELFKVIALGKGLSGPLSGFSQGALTRLL